MVVSKGAMGGTMVVVERVVATIFRPAYPSALFLDASPNSICVGLLALWSAPRQAAYLRPGSTTCPDKRQRVLGAYLRHGACGLSND